MAWTREQLSYCSNVHPGESSDEIECNIRQYCGKVREQRKLADMYGALWLSAQSVEQYLNSEESLDAFHQCLAEQHIQLSTLNAFPYGGFHREVVKETVYVPDWSTEQRLRYTCQCAELLALSLPNTVNYATLSTLPLGFPATWNSGKHQKSLLNLLALVRQLKELAKQTGKYIQVCIEMEPGCVLESTKQLIDFFELDLLPFAKLNNLNVDEVLCHIGVCFDVCHQAVMFESCYKSLQHIHESDISIGKIQFSNALCVEKPDDDIVDMLLKEFAEPVYFHQLKSLNKHNQLMGIMDLTDIRNSAISYDSPWRIHFHLPLQMTTLFDSRLSSTHQGIEETCHFLADYPQVQPTLEVETYTWHVLPEAYRVDSDIALVKGISQELAWLEVMMTKYDLLLEEG